ncbi:MAG TPA: hypothetical protein VMC61_02365 [Methanocella sp.]|jgi:hypothetical protein|nr:hypothetical protein [Methanocella sp.]
MSENKILSHLKLAEVNLELYENRIRVKRSNGVMDIYLHKLESAGFDNKEIWLSVASGQTWKFSRATASDSQIIGFIDMIGSR